MLVSLVGLLFCAGVLLWTAVLCSCLLLDCCFVQLSLVGLLFFPGASCWTADCIFYIYIYTHTHTGWCVVDDVGLNDVLGYQADIRDMVPRVGLVCYVFLFCFLF